MIERFYRWHEWRKAYWGLIDRYPELFAFLHRMYVFQHFYELGRFDRCQSFYRLDLSKIWRPVLLKIKRRWPSHKRSEPSAATYEGSPVSVSSRQIDILFYTYSNRDTCLGVGEKLFANIQASKRGITGAYYQNGRHKILDSDRHRGMPVITLSVIPTLKGLIRFFLLLPIVYGYGISSVSVFKFITRHPLVTAINLLKITTASACIGKLLDRAKPKVLIACNEQGGEDNSILFALARKKGIHAIQYMHAVPTKQFVPFICDEYWSWSELTTNMLIGNGKDGRILNIGSLEHENKETISNKQTTVNDSEWRVLFLSQIGMDEAWGIHAVGNAINLFRTCILGYKANMKVKVREHPGAGRQQREMLERAMTGISYEITTKEIPLAADVEWATHVYSVSSNAIFSGLLGGKPSFLFWNDELDEIYGRCFLPDECVINSLEDMKASLKKALSAGHAEDILQKVLGPPGALDRATRRTIDLVTLC